MFREEAIEYQSKKWKSTAVLFSRVPALVVFSISFFIFTAFILFIVFGNNTRRETVVGELVMQSHPILLSAPKSGYISENYIQPHQQVKKRAIRWLKLRWIELRIAKILMLILFFR